MFLHDHVQILQLSFLEFYLRGCVFGHRVVVQDLQAGRCTLIQPDGHLRNHRGEETVLGGLLATSVLGERAAVKLLARTMPQTRLNSN